MEAREIKGLEIASGSKITRNGQVWVVPSQHSNKRYTVDLSTIPSSCTCPDYESTGRKCKHIFAVEYIIQCESDGSLPAQTAQAQRPTYKQEWTEYNQAQINEKARFLELLYELCRNVESSPRKSGAGRTPLPLPDMIFCTTYKVYSMFSGRRFISDLREAQRRGLIRKTPHFNSIFNYLELKETTDILKELIVESSLPLKSVEVDFAVDSSGFSTSKFVRWFDVKYGNTEDWRDWIKAHIMCGVKTNIVTGVEISGRHAGDSPYFKPLSPSRGEELPQLPPLRTARARFHACRSSLS